MATAWESNVESGTDREAAVRNAITSHLMTLSQMTTGPDLTTDAGLLKQRIAKSLGALGVSSNILDGLSGDVEKDVAMIGHMDMTPVITFATLKSARRLIDSKEFQDAHNLMTPFVQRFPEHSEAHYLLARAAVGLWNFDEAEGLFQQAIALDTTRLETYTGLATLYEKVGKYDLADKTWRRGFEYGAIYKRGYLGKKQDPIRILVVSSVLAGNIRFMRFLNQKEFLITSVLAESYTPELFLPDHDVIFQAIGDTELCVRGAEIARQIAARSNAPIINNPDFIVHTSREENSERFRKLENVVTPLTKTFDRELLKGEGADAFLHEQGFTYPVLMRSPGYFNGHYFEKIESKDDIARVVESLPGNQLIVIQYIDTMRADGTIRKYRVMGIDKKLYPVHLAISYNWKIHYFSSNMRDKQEFRDEEYAFLYDMEQTLGPKVLKALSDIVATLGLDYCGIDFTINDDGQVVVFEANATMALLLPDASSEWNYRRTPIQTALNAAKNLIYTRVPHKADAAPVALAAAAAPGAAKRVERTKKELTRAKKRSERKAKRHQ